MPHKINNAPTTTPTFVSGGIQHLVGGANLFNKNMLFREIHLTQGKIAIVDENEYFFLGRFKWFAYTNRDRTLWYAARYEDNVRIVMHREIMGLTPNDRLVVDHIDGDGLNNTRFNLRICQKVDNAINRKKQLSPSSSKYKGLTKVFTRKGTPRWEVYINHKKNRHYVGVFDVTPEGEIAAAKAYDEAAKKLHGKFARLNFK